MSEEIDEKFLPLLALAKDRPRRLELLDLETVRLAAKFKNRYPKHYAQLILSLSAWELVGTFKTEVTRRSAAAKRAKEEDDKQAEAMERLAKADRDGMSRVNEGHPLDVARDFLTQVRPNLMVTGSRWLDFEVNHYREFEKATIRAGLQEWMGNAVSAETGNRVLVNRKILDDVMDALSNAAHVPADTVKPPTWLESEPGDPEPSMTIACRNGLLDVRTHELHANTPRFYTRAGLPYDYEDPCFVLPPYEFLRFLEQIWPEAEGAGDNKLALQEWFGYLLTGSNRYQKILLLMGESRAGKGVILRIIKAIVGASNVTSMDFEKLVGQHGTSALVGKSVMMIPDVVLTRDSHKALGLILAISGGDDVSVNPKFKDLTSAPLDVRMVLATNETMSLPDRSGAFANRLHPLVFTKTFRDNPDIHLADRIIANELPGILHWALEGLHRLEANGAFTMPEASTKTLTAIRHQAGPVNMFVKERCVIEEGAVIRKADMWRAFESYCEELDIQNRFIPESFGTVLMRNATGFFRVEADRGVIDGRRVTIYRGIRLKDEFAKQLAEDEDDY